MPTILRCDPNGIRERELKEILAALDLGELILFPTDTVYGIGGNALLPQVFERLYALKSRPPSKPLPILVHSSEAARRWVEWSSQAEALVKKFWPGPLTLVLQASKEGAKISHGFKNLGLRVPRHPALLRLLRRSDLPLASTSANISGKPAAREIGGIGKALRDAAAYLLDGGRAPGAESTVVDLTGPSPSILRHGAVPEREIWAVVEMNVLFVCTGNTCRSVMAHQLLKKMLNEHPVPGPPWSLKSCGIAAQPYFQVPPVVRDVLASHGVPAFSHDPVPISKELVDWAGLVLAMTEEHIQALNELFPGGRTKFHLLRKYAGCPEPWEVPDPVGREESTYRSCLQSIQEGLSGVLKKCTPI